LKSIFKPLKSNAENPSNLLRTKAYGTTMASWLRLYEIKVDSNMYIITGGSIKLTQRMEDRKHTMQELIKLDMCREFLRSEGIFDEAGMVEFLESEF